MDQRTQRLERRREQVRDDILEATRKVLLQKGLSGFTLAAVGRELSLTKAALYYYFDSKEALVFELIYQHLARHAELVGEAVDGTSTGADAVEALIRAAARHYGESMDELRLAYMVPQIGTSAAIRVSPENLERIRPFNDRIYGSVAARIAADQRAGRVPMGIEPRRLALLAHTAVVGLLTLEGLVEAADDGPLLHDHRALVDDLVATFRARLE